MSTFTTIPLEEIQKFLRSQGLSLPLDQEETYLQAWEYLEENPGLFVSSVPIQDFLLAHDHQEEVIERRTTSSILFGSDDQLIGLAQTLGLTGVNKERIIRILGYLKLLDNDMSVFNALPKDALRLIGLRLDCQSLRLFCSISQTFNQLFCLTGDLTEMLRVKLQENTQLNLSSYNRKELDFLCRIGNRNTVLSAGGAHTLARTSQGLVYGFGENRSGWLGLGDTENRTTPQLLNVFDIIAVSAGDYHSLILNSQGQVFSFGENYKGQLGAGSLRQKLITIPTLIRRREIGQIMAISAGSIHSLILNSQGQVFSFGSDEEGQLGIGYEEESEYYPAPVRIRALENIIAISAGYDHSLFLNSQGQVYSCGGNEYGQLGIGDDVDEQETPTLIETSEIGKIIAIAAGSFFSLILNSQGQVYSFGENGSGQLGLKDEDNRSAPTLINTSDIVSIAIGSNHSLLLNSQGKVFSFGNDESGQLGLDRPENEEPLVNIPTLIKAPVGKIIAISAGGEHSLIMNSQGQVFGFGNNTDGRLGLGDTDDKYSPTLIEGLVI